MSSIVDKAKPYRCLCGKSFNSLSELQKHIDDRIDATDFKIHGQGNVPGSL